MPAVTPGTLRAIGTIGARRGAGASARKWADKRRWIPSEVIHQIMCDGIHITDALIYAATQLAEHGHGAARRSPVARRSQAERT